MTKRLASLYRFFFDAVSKYRRTRRVFVSDSEASRRKGICDSCPKMKKGMCEVCGCVMALKTKFAAAKCPLPDGEKKW